MAPTHNLHLNCNFPLVRANRRRVTQCPKLSTQPIPASHFSLRNTSSASYIFGASFYESISRPIQTIVNHTSHSFRAKLRRRVWHYEAKFRSFKFAIYILLIWNLSLDFELSSVYYQSNYGISTLFCWVGKGQLRDRFYWAGEWRLKKRRRIYISGAII